MPRLTLQFFGPPQIVLDGAPINTDRRKAIALLVYLAVTGREHARDALAALLWPDFDRARAFAYLRRLQFDDGFSVPLHYLTPGMQVPLVPIAMNCTVPPIPTTADAYRLGETLREIILRRWPGQERVAVVGTGGLSHEPGGPRYFWVDEEFDRWFLDLLKQGDHAALLRECTLERMEAAGSGGTAELLAWVLVLAFTRGPAEVLAYMPAVAWRSGTGMVTWNEMA